MRIGIVGSRTFNDLQLVRNTIDPEGIILVVSGGAKGADSLAEQFAAENNIPTLVFKPEWKKYGYTAGFIRNTTIVENSDHIYAFWDGSSRGTMDTVNKARAQGVPVTLVEYNLTTHLNFE